MSAKTEKRARKTLATATISRVPHTEKHVAKPKGISTLPTPAVMYSFPVKLRPALLMNVPVALFMGLQDKTYKVEIDHNRRVRRLAKRNRLTIEQAAQQYTYRSSNRGKLN